jgi:hypothetical protein
MYSSNGNEARLADRDQSVRHHFGGRVRFGSIGSFF